MLSIDIPGLVELVRRVRTLTLTLLPVEVPLDSISDPTSRIITPQVIKAYIAAAGDLVEAVRCFPRHNLGFIESISVEAPILLAPLSQRVYVGCEPQSC